MTNQELIARHNQSMMLNYGKQPAVMVRGAGSILHDAGGKEYIDLFAGFGGTILGHAYPALVAAAAEQAKTLWAVGNQFYTEPQLRLAEQLKATAFDGRAFFCHSGAEANEGAIKLARLAGQEKGKFKIISMLRGFHGRTLGALSATPTPEYQKGFFPLVPGFSAVPFNDLPALAAAIDKETCAVLLEPIQGEGGIHMPAPGYLQGVRDLCDQHELTLIFDEVWTGCGRTGKYFAHQWPQGDVGGTGGKAGAEGRDGGAAGGSGVAMGGQTKETGAAAGGARAAAGARSLGVQPDIMTLGKALGGGLPTGCFFAIPEKAALLKPGTHGCTLGGNPICAAVSAKVLETIADEGLTERAQKLGNAAMDRIRSFKNAGNRIKQVRGSAFFIGVELQSPDGAPVVSAALERGLVINATSKNVLRICPALTIPEAVLNRGLDLLEAALG